MHPVTVKVSFANEEGGDGSIPATYIELRGLGGLDPCIYAGTCLIGYAKDLKGIEIRETPDGVKSCIIFEEFVEL